MPWPQSNDCGHGSYRKFSARCSWEAIIASCIVRVLVIREKPGESSVIANEQRSISSSLSLVEVDVYVYVYTAMRLSYFHEIGAATGRRCSAFQPVFTSYKLLESKRCENSLLHATQLLSPEDERRWCAFLRKTLARGI